MLCIFSSNKDPYFNLAAEEYLLTQTMNDYFIVWQSIPVVVCGKHQNVLAEINYPLVRKSSIAIARRLSGGGTVFHDEGNLNFSFIKTGVSGKLVDFSAFIRPIIEFLDSIGITAVEGKKHEILVSGNKISGNAEHVFRNRVLHHGTLLLDSDLEMLNSAIHRTGGTYTDKAVQSNRSTVVNLSDCMKEKMSMALFGARLFKSVLQQAKGREYTYNESETTAIEQLSFHKYQSWEWIYGWSPDYEYNHYWTCKKGKVEIQFQTHRGVITASNIRSDKLPVYCNSLNKLLIHEQHEENLIRSAIHNSGFASILSHEEADEFTNQFF